MAQVSGEQRNRVLAVLWSGLLAVVLALVGGVTRAELSPTTAWAFDLLARVEQWQLAGPLDFLQNVAKGQSVPGVAKARIQDGYGRLPMHFEPNLGQTADEVKFVARGPGYTLFLTADEAVLALRPSRPASNRADPRHRGQPFDLAAMAQDDTPPVPGAVIRTRLEGATRNSAPQPEGLEKLPGISNYFLGNDPAKWRTHVPHYQRVRYPNVYPGIDLVYYGNPQRLEHDFIVAPGADPAAIQLAISGADQATVNAEGDLVLTVPGGEVVQQAPRIYQVIDGRQQAVAGRYVLRDTAPGTSPTVNVAAAEPAPPSLLVGFEVAQYDRHQPLVIDPVLVYSTYLGGSGEDYGRGIAVDGAGNVYVTGVANSADFPAVNALYPNWGGSYDVFIIKLDTSSNALIYSTYLGGSSVEWGFGIAVDDSGNAYVTGNTGSADFPTRNAPYPNLGGGSGGSDAFIAKLNASGTALVYSTYLGGSHSIYGDTGYSIAVDGAGNAYVIGMAGSADFPAINALYPNFGGFFDAFIAKLNASGTALVYSTYLGGNGYDWGQGIAVDSAGNAYVVGTTDSANFPTHNALDPQLGSYRDVFIAKLNPDGTALVYSTYLGGSNWDEGRGIAIDSAGNVYMTGATGSTDFPAVNALAPHKGGSSDAFIAKLNASGTALVYATYLGGSNYDSGTSISVDGAGNVYVTGETGSTDFPAVNALDPNYDGWYVDAFITKLNASGRALIYSTFLGGSGEDGSYGIAVDSTGNAYVTGYTISTDFPTHNATYPEFRGGKDAFIAKIADGGSNPPSEEKVAVVLVHGIAGSAGSFSDDGELYRDGTNGEEVCSDEEYRFDPTCQPKFGRLLAKNAGLIVAKPFDYSDKTGLLAAEWTIEQLAGELHKHIECILAASSDCIHLLPGIDHIDRVDIVAHSMGGLITRAYIAGIAQNCIRDGDDYCQSSTSVAYPEVNGKGIIRKFVTVGTPHYGSNYLNRLREFFITTSNQSRQMKVGSKLVIDLHGNLSDKGIHDTDLLAIAGLRIPNKREKDEDGIVSASSAMLPTELLAEDKILYVPYRHMSFDNPNITCQLSPLDPTCTPIPPWGGTTLVGVNNEQHLTYQLVREFLSDRPVHSLYMPKDGILKQGLLTLSLINAKTGARVAPGDPEVMLKNGSAITVQKFSKNPEGALVDFVNGSEDPYAIQVNAPRGYFQPVMLDNVVITKGRPIMATVALTPAPDLAIVNVDPACVRSGQTTIAIRVKNQGEASSSSTQGILASSSFAIPALEPRTAKTIRVTIIVGTSLVTAIVDSNNAVSESDETNNQITIMGCSTQ